MYLFSHISYFIKDFIVTYEKEKSNYEEKNEAIKNRKKIS